MAVRPIVVVPHKALSQKAQKVTDIDECILRLARDMADTMYKAPGIGLAANQVGETVRLIVVDVEYAYADPEDKKKNPVIIINPTICSREGTELREEGCLSVPEFNLEVARAQCVQVKGFDLKGNPLMIDAEGLLARVLQHEIDHLDGTTLLDHASVLKRNLYRKRHKKKPRGDR
ncbi:MAG: peptide deformylase [Deltaproteobacteria bacterium]|nr:peptide deformylase [Deltaproteobacteria bacterium]